MVVIFYLGEKRGKISILIILKAKLEASLEPSIDKSEHISYREGGSSPSFKLFIEIAKQFTEVLQ